MRSHVGPLSGTDLRFNSPQPDTSLHSETTNTKLVHRAACLFTPPAFAGTHCTLPRKDDQAALILADRDGLPAKDGHPSRH